MVEVGSVPSIFGIIVRGRAVDFSLAFLARTIVYQCTPFQDLCDLGSRFRLGRLKGGQERGRKVMVASIGAENQLVVKPVDQDSMGIEPGLP